jgi:hypothetical protein
MLSLPRSDPQRAVCVQRLARARFKRHAFSGKLDDLEQSILGFAEAIYLQLPRDIPPLDLNFVQIFYYLSLAISFRARMSKHPEDVKYCITYLRYLRKEWNEVSIDFPSPVMATLSCALAVQVELGLGNVDQDIEEMTNLCRLLVKSDLSKDFLTKPILIFAKVVNAHLLRLPNGKIPSEHIIDCLRRAVTQLPDLHDVSYVFTRCLLIRFVITHSDNDYKEGMDILNKIITFRGPGDRWSPWRKMALKLATNFSQTRYGASREPEHLEQTICRTRAELEETSEKDPNHAAIAKQLSQLEILRFHRSSVSTNAQNVLPSTPEFSQLPSFRDLITSLPELNSTKPIPMTISNKLESVERLTDLAEIEDGVDYCRPLLGSYPSSPLVRYARFALGNLLYRAFQCQEQDKIEYLNKAISAARDNVNNSDTPMDRDPLLLILIEFLTTRLKLQPNGEDLTELMELFPIATKHEILGSRLSPVSCRWASIARLFGHPSVSTAYECAISSMHASLIFAPTLDTQHSRLVGMSGDFKTLPLAYASY